MYKKSLFSLIELLIVFSILGILTSLLQPSLKKMVQSAESLHCKNNLKQLGIALSTYADSEGYYPVGIGRGAWIWPTLIRSYLDDSNKTEIFKCPTAPDEAQWNVVYDNNLPAELGYFQGERRLRANGTTFMSYGYNVWGSFPYVNKGLGVHLGDQTRGERLVNSIVRPDNMIAMADSNWDLDRNGDSRWSGFIGMYAERQWPLDLHNYYANLQFADGHVEELQRIDFVGQLNTDPQARQEAAKKWNSDNQPYFN